MVDEGSTPIANLIDNGDLVINDGYRAKNSELSAEGLPFARARNINNGFRFEEADQGLRAAREFVGAIREYLESAGRG